MMSRRTFLRSSGSAAAALGTALSVEAFAREPAFALTVKEWQVRHAKWAGPPLRIAVLTDIHAVDPWMPVSRIAAIAARANALQPDAVVLLGDYVNALNAHFYSAVVPTREWAKALSALAAPLGVFAVLGNHDWWAGDVPAIRGAFAKTGIRLLENQAVRLVTQGYHFWIAGLGDQLAYRDRGVDDLQGTLTQARESEPLLLMVHEPDIFPKVPNRVTLTLAGHTHGGQVYLPIVGRPLDYLNRSEGVHARYVYGHIEEQGRHLLISSGLGVSHYPVRFMVPPEIALVTLRSTAV